jgi:hypothetical protein
VRSRTTTAAAAVAAAALGAALALPAVAAAPHRGGTYGGGFLEDIAKIPRDPALGASEDHERRMLAAVRNVVTAKVAADGSSVDVAAWVAYRCGAGARGVSGRLDFYAKVGGDGRFSARVAYAGTGAGAPKGTAKIRGTIDRATAAGTLSLTAGSCREVEQRWTARDPDARHNRRGGARGRALYSGTNSHVQDLFDAKGAPAPLMLRTSKSGGAVTQAHMRAQWSCKEGAGQGDSFFTDHDLAQRYPIARDGTFGKATTLVVPHDDGTVTTFRTTFEGRFARGIAKGRWREVTEERASADSPFVTGGCDTGVVRWRALP